MLLGGRGDEGVALIGRSCALDCLGSYRRAGMHVVDFAHILNLGLPITHPSMPSECLDSLRSNNDVPIFNTLTMHHLSING